MAGAAPPSGRQPWQGVNLGGWLLLEPGPSGPLFPSQQRHCLGEELECEWSFMQVLRRRRALGVLTKHRETFYTKEDFLAIRRCGLNAVRLPFGHWVVLGPGAGEPYEGPALEYVDRAVAWAEEVGLEVLLDLHGAPGGESGCAPSGRQQDGWHWSHWQFDKSLEALRILAQRYRCSKAVTGIAVCNEPSKSVPAKVLCRFYDSAVDAIRGTGMHERQVAITLPCFQRDLPEFAQTWESISGGRHKNICFDLHHYYCFGSKANGRSLAEHLRLIQLRGEEMLRYPVVVGEWSLAVGDTAERAGLRRADLGRLFARAQTEAYSHASHGFFFWCWKDRHSIEWSYLDCHAAGLLQKGPAPELPAWDDRGQDPLDLALERMPRSPGICYGDVVQLRGYNGEFVGVGPGQAPVALSSEPGSRRQLVLCPGFVCASRTARRLGAKTAAVAAAWGSPVREGDAVMLLTHNGTFVAVRSGKCCQETAAAAAAPYAAAAQFILRRAARQTGGSREELRHTDRVSLRTLAAKRALEACAGDGGGLAARPPAPATTRQTWRDLAKESAEVGADTRQGFSIERSKQRRFSRGQMRVLASWLVAEGRRRGAARRRAGGKRPEQTPGPVRKRRWHGLLARSATKRQRTQLEAWLPTSHGHA